MQRLGACGLDGERRGGSGDVGQRGRLGGNDGLAQSGADRSQQQGRSEKKRIRFHIQLAFSPATVQEGMMLSYTIY